MAGQMRVEVHGVARADAAMDYIVEHTRLVTGLTVKKVLGQIQRQTRVNLSLGWHAFGTKTGSIPPQPPWRISGHLSRSVVVEGPFLRGQNVWWGRVGPTAVYARIHELSGWTGAGHRTFLPARPYFRPALDLVRPTIAATVYKAWARSSRPPRW